MAEQVEMKKTLGLTGVTVNAMALIAPGAFCWLTFQMQAAQVDFEGKTTAMDMFGGLVVALILSFLTAASFSKLSELYPQSGTGSSYYFAEQAMLNEHRLSPLSRLSKFVVGWFSHLYYWAMAGVMVAMMATLITYIFSQFGIELSAAWQIITAIIFACLIGYIAYRGITGSTVSSMITNVTQIVCLVVVSILALVYRFSNPEHVTFVHPDFSSVVLPHSLTNVMFQATVAILLLVGFESASALTAESKSPRHVSRGVVISLIIQGLFCYVLQYVSSIAWLNTSYTGKDAKDVVVSGIDAAAASSAPIGDMVKNLGDALLGNMGFALLVVVSIAVVIALSGSALATMNTGVRLTYAMSKDKEIPSFLGVLHPKHATPHACVIAIIIVSAIIGSYGVLSITNLTAITFISNIGTFIFYGMTNLIALVAFWSSPQRKTLSHIVVPILGALANLAMLVAILYLGILGGGDTQTAAMIAVVTTVAWFVIGVGCLLVQSSRLKRKIIARPSVSAN